MYVCIYILVKVRPAPVGGGTTTMPLCSYSRRINTNIKSRPCLCLWEPPAAAFSVSWSWHPRVSPPPPPPPPPPPRLCLRLPFHSNPFVHLETHRGGCTHHTHTPGIHVPRLQKGAKITPVPRIRHLPLKVSRPRCPSPCPGACPGACLGLSHVRRGTLRGLCFIGICHHLCSKLLKG